MDQRIFVFATRGHCIKGKQCQHIAIKNKKIIVFKTIQLIFLLCTALLWRIKRRSGPLWISRCCCSSSSNASKVYLGRLFTEHGFVICPIKCPYFLQRTLKLSPSLSTLTYSLTFSVISSSSRETIKMNLQNLKKSESPSPTSLHTCW